MTRAVVLLAARTICWLSDVFPCRTSLAEGSMHEVFAATHLTVFQAHLHDE